MLDESDRAFFGLAADAAFANPFGPDRARLDAALQREDLSERVASAADLDVSDPAERRVLIYARLFVIFHENAGRLDALIEEQRQAGDVSVKVPFAREVILALREAGLRPDEAVRYFALFFQLRRAYLFIEESLRGGSASMQGFREALWNNLFTHDARLYARSLWMRMEDFSTFLVGETGTGKGTAAAAIGRAAFIPFDPSTQCFAESFEKGFVSINLSQYPETLIESELFGHTRGAFTGAATAHDGLFSRCSPHGAVFLDEIGEASAPVQIKLLRVLQERTFTPVGGQKVLRFSGRVVAATNRPEAELRRGSFRDDFYYRLCSDVIEVPPLRQRIAEDSRELPTLVRVILARITGGEADASLSRKVDRAIEQCLPARYPWPGNVRELEQCVRRVLLTGRYVGSSLAASASSADTVLLDVAGDDTARGLAERYVRALYSRHQSYEEVARRSGLDRRTVKAYVTAKG